MGAVNAPSGRTRGPGPAPGTPLLPFPKGAMGKPGPEREAFFLFFFFAFFFGGVPMIVRFTDKWGLLIKEIKCLLPGRLPSL